MSNPHTQLAQLRATGVHDWQSGEGSTDATNIAAILDAQVEATLALAYEQNTANQIAMQQLEIAIANCEMAISLPLGNLWERL